MSWRLLKTILILPGNVAIVVPAVIVWLSHGTRFAAAPAGPARIGLWLGVLAAAAGLVLAIWTVRLFATQGDGTPAPWDPTAKLVVDGPYRHVRNPMITGVLLVLGAEALILQSWPIAVWMAFFFTTNAIYFPLSEEKGLEERFGDDYRSYKANVPRWIPRMTPWAGP